MLHRNLVVLALAVQSYAAPQNYAAKEIPVKGDNGKVGGVFGLTEGAKRPSQEAGIGGMQRGSEAPKGFGGNDNLPGTGPYPAQVWPADPSLPAHTIYAPKSAPKDVKLPVLVWANGGCANSGLGFQNFLREIASHGFIAVANGGAGGMGFGQTKMTAMTETLDWVMKGAGDGKYGTVDSSKIATAGQSCGGLESLSASYHDDRVKTTMVMNSGVIEEEKKYLLQELKAPIAYFIGGPKDIAYKNAESDWEKLPKTLPAVKLNLDTGHGGTYGAPSGGKFGKAAVAYLKWQFKGDQEAKKAFLDKDSVLVKDGWNITSRNWS